MDVISPGPVLVFAHALTCALAAGWWILILVRVGGRELLSEAFVYVVVFAALEVLALALTTAVVLQRRPSERFAVFTFVVVALEVAGVAAKSFTPVLAVPWLLAACLAAVAHLVVAHIQTRRA